MEAGETNVFHENADDESLLTAVTYDGEESNKQRVKNVTGNENLSSFAKSSAGDLISTDEDSSLDSVEEPEHLTSNCETMIHLLKANVGTGILAMPDAFKNMGLIAALFMMAILGFLCVHCQHILLTCGKEIGIRINERALNYADVAEYSFKLGPERTRRYSTVARRIVDFFLIVTQIGFCAVYFVFIASNISTILVLYGSSHLSLQALMAIILPFMIIYSFIKNLKTLAPISMLANILLTVGLAIIFYDICQNLPPISTRPYIAHYTTWPLFFGTAIYTFEGIGMVLPIENKMKNPDDFRGWTGVLNTGMVIVASCFCGVGFYGYLKYGDEVRGSITFILPKHILFDSVKIMFAIGVFISYALMLYVPVQIIWPNLARRIPNPRVRNIMNYVFRASLVIFSFAMAEIVPHLDVVISLVGAVGSSSLALIFPPIIEIVLLHPNRYGRFHWKLIKDILLCLFGLFGFFVGTYATIAKAIETTSAKHHKQS